MFTPNEKSVSIKEFEQVYKGILTTLKLESLPGWAEKLSDSPHLLKGFWEMMKGFLHKNQLPPLLQELIIFSVSRYNESVYCMDLHGGNALRLNSALQVQDLLDISNGNSNGLLPTNYQAAIDTAVAYAIGVCDLHETYLKKLHENGFDEPQIADILGLISLANTFNTYSVNLNFTPTQTDPPPVTKWPSGR